MDTDFDVYATPNGVMQISNTVRRQVLSFLSLSDLSLTEISNMAGKAQSTLSVHMDKMVNDGLVTFRDDPSDSRKKIFSLSSKLVARSRDANEESKKAYHKAIEDLPDRNRNFFKTLMRALIIGMEAHGLCLGASLRRLGTGTGLAMAKNMKSTKVEDIVSEIQEFYEIHGIGEVCVYTFMPLTIIVRDNDELTSCVSESISMFSQGLFITVFEEITKKRYRIVSSESFGADNNYSKFVIEQII